MNKDSRIFIAGHRGLVGSAIVRQLEKQPYHNILCAPRNRLDLCQQAQVAEYFAQHKPEYVVLAAAKVGGIMANLTYPAQFINENINIQQNIIQQCHSHKVKRLIFLGSSCIYPKLCQQPIKESELLSGPLEFTNRPYALAKISGIEMCWAYNRQYSTDFIALMPTNLYGLNDNYHSENSHVIPALIKKFHQAKINNLKQIKLWGTGAAKREFLFADDLAQACLHMLNLDEKKYQAITQSHTQAPILNIGVGHDISIKDLAILIQSLTGFQGDIIWNTDKPDGTPQKLLDVTKIHQLGWQAKTPLEEGLQIAYCDFQEKSCSTETVT